MDASAQQPDHRRLGCGIDLAVLPTPGRAVVAVEIRVLAGYAYEAEDRLGVTHALEEAITKGTAHFDGRGLNDAFDEIGASHGSFPGREAVGFSALCLPEFMERTIELLAEIIRTPTFPEDACRVAVDLTTQSLAALEDDPQELAKKLLHRQAYGCPLGRHVLGEPETLEKLRREDIVQQWQRCFGAGRMLVSVAGPVDPSHVADLLERRFAGFGRPDDALPTSFPLEFHAARTHHEKDVEQVQIGICFPGATAEAPDFPTEQVAVWALGGGMSGRLFTEVREKQGLVYWVGAWSDQPRRSGVVHMGASCTPENVERTYSTLLRELDRLAVDVTQEELDRAINGIVTRALTRGEVTRAKAGEMIDDLFHYGRPIPTQEKLDRVRAVRVADVRDYLSRHPRDRLSVVTLGPTTLEA